MATATRGRVKELVAADRERAGAAARERREARDALVLGAARALADGEGRVKIADVAARLRGSLPVKATYTAVTSLKARGLWPYRKAARIGTDREPREDHFRIDPADLERERARRCPPPPARAGAEPTLAGACRAMVREWKVMTGRLRPRTGQRVAAPARVGGAPERRRERAAVMRWNGVPLAGWEDEG